MRAMLIDAGNTALKWAEYREGEVGSQHQLLHRQQALARALLALVRPGFQPERVMAGNVAGPAMRDVIERVAVDCLGCEPTFVAVEPDAYGLRIAYRDPARLGVDRWLAMLGALRRGAQPCLVVDLGTAVTVDGVDADGRHLGGAIAPGRRLMPAALRAGTARIEALELMQAAVSAFANDTGPALRAGADQALLGLIERAFAELRALHGDGVSLLLTGGDAPAVSPLVREAHQVVPGLVLDGLAHILERGG